MKSSEIRKKFVDFFGKRGHKELPPAPLIPENDPSVLFTSAGMQKFKDYYLFPEKSPCKKITTIQPCFRTSDIEEVGDNCHLTLLEMLGNFSFGDYFKFDAIHWADEFIREELKIPLKRIHVTIFRGDKFSELDDESIKIWRDLGMPDEKIKMGTREDNWWGPTGEQGPCGPTTEIYVDDHEIWNIVFNQYYQDKNKKLAELANPGVDTGAGLERLAAAMQNVKSIYQTDLFLPIYKKVQKNSSKINKYSQIIVTEHARAITFLLSAGIMPSNKEQGYVTRRLIRRLVTHSHLLGIKDNTNQLFLEQYIKLMGDIYPDLKDNRAKILENFVSEENKFLKTLKLGLKHFNKILSGKKISGKDAFMLYDSFGFPLELTEELAIRKKIKVDKAGFNKELNCQKERSRTAAKGFFKGGMGGLGDKEIKYHTATHLLHAALRKVLGKHVGQKGSNINPERLRFDFSHPDKLTSKQIKKIEDLVNQQIKKSLPVKMEEMSLAQAKKQGALAFFNNKYGTKVKVYSIGPSTSSGQPCSVEVCGGPHVKNTRELGVFKITSEKSSSSGIRRIKAILK